MSNNELSPFPPVLIIVTFLVGVFSFFIPLLVPLGVVFVHPYFQRSDVKVS